MQSWWWLIGRHSLMAKLDWEQRQSSRLYLLFSEKNNHTCTLSMQHGTTRWKTTPVALAARSKWKQTQGPRSLSISHEVMRLLIVAAGAYPCWVGCGSHSDRLRASRGLPKSPTSHWKSQQRTESAKFLQIEWCLLHSINLPQLSLAYSNCVTSCAHFFAFNFLYFMFAHF